MSRSEAQLATQRLMVLLFTDLVGSSALKVDLGDSEYVEHIAKPHNRLFHDLLAQFSEASENNYTGDGFLATFASVADAVNFALLFHYALRTHEWQRTTPACCIGIHTGDTTLFEGNDPSRCRIASHPADMCARVMSLAVVGHPPGVCEHDNPQSQTVLMAYFRQSRCHEGLFCE